MKINRDLNASVNILNEGKNTLGHRGINACGDDKVHDFSKEKSGGHRRSKKKNLHRSHGACPVECHNRIYYDLYFSFL